MYFNVNFNMFFKLIKVHLLVSELYRTMKVLQTWSPAKGVVINTEKSKAISYHAWRNKSFLKPEIDGVLI